MSARAWIEAGLVSAGLVACLVASLVWGFGHPQGVSGQLLDPRYSAAILASLRIGASSGLGLGVLGTALSAAYLFTGGRPSHVVLTLSLASAFTPDLVHALIWRAVMQPGLGSVWVARTLASTGGQTAAVGLVLAVKWAPLAAVFMTETAGDRRRSLARTLQLAGISTFRSALRAFAPHMRRCALIALFLGVLLGLRQHELSDVLFGGGTGFEAEGLSQWVAKVALNFLDPGLAAAQLLLLLAVVLGLVGGAALLAHLRRSEA